jgi:hypothetical protein
MLADVASLDRPPPRLDPHDCSAVFPMGQPPLVRESMRILIQQFADIDPIALKGTREQGQGTRTGVSRKGTRTKGTRTGVSRKNKALLRETRTGKASQRSGARRPPEPRSGRGEGQGRRGRRTGQKGQKGRRGRRRGRRTGNACQRSGARRPPEPQSGKLLRTCRGGHSRRRIAPVSKRGHWRHQLTTITGAASSPSTRICLERSTEYC